MVDPDDVTFFELQNAFRDLCDACGRLGTPSMGIIEWFQMTAAVLIAGQAPGRPLDWVMLLTARRVTSDILSSL